MRRSRTIPLDDDLVAFIDEQVAGGRYASATEVVEAGLRLLEIRDALRAALIEGEASVGFKDFDADACLASMQRPAAR
ncbi:type II toxin-antitoxin system ParD family antitoxin [Methylobacterium sp. Gmos1]